MKQFIDHCNLQAACVKDTFTEVNDVCTAALWDRADCELLIDSMSQFRYQRSAKIKNCHHLFHVFTQRRKLKTQVVSRKFLLRFRKST